MTDFRMRAARSTYALFSIAFGILIAFFIFVALRRPAASGVWTPVALMGVLLGALLVYFASLEVRVSQGMLSCRSLFGTQSILLSEVAQSRLETVRRGKGRTVYLVVTPAQGGKPVRIIVKPFRLEDVRKLLAIPELRYVEKSILNP